MRRKKTPGRLAQGAGMGRYLKEAFTFRWNMLLFFGGIAASFLSPWPDIAFPLVAAAELAYLAGVVSIPKFRWAIDAKAHEENRQQPTLAKGRRQTARSLADIVTSLPPEKRYRFEKLHSRCLEMRDIAHGVRGSTEAGGPAGEEIRTPALDRLLWVFLRLLVSETALERFLETTDEAEIGRQLEALRENLSKAKSEEPGDERIIRSLQDSVAVNEMRLDNYRKAEKNEQFVTIELDRIEGKIQALTEMSVSRQDPDFLSSQVDSVAESMKQTERAISELQHITGLADELEEPPAILESNLREVLRQ